MRFALLFAGVGIGVFLLLTALGVGSGAGAPTVAAAAPATAPQKHLTVRQKYSADVGRREAGQTFHGRILDEEVPFAPKRFAAPVAAYKRYAQRQTTVLSGDVARLRTALAAGSRGPARTAWRAAFGDYLRLGAVYGQFGTLDQKIDGQADGNPHFTGLHAIERGLWGSASVASLQPLGTRLAADVKRLPATIRRDPIAPLDYATRSHEILEDAQRDYLSGVDVPWSGAGVIATASGLAATRVVVNTLVPLLRGRDALPAVQLGLDRLGATLHAIRSAHGGLPSLDALSRSEREHLDGSLSFALERLQLLPGQLETQDVPAIPRLP